MASPLVQKISAWLRSAQGRRAIEQIRTTANRPENRQRLAGLLRRLRGSRRR
jgi:hypothetical protein